MIKVKCVSSKSCHQPTVSQLVHIQTPLHPNLNNALSSPMASADDEVVPTDFFQEPNDYYQPKAPPRFVDYTLLSGKTLHLRLVGSNPLWVSSQPPLPTTNPNAVAC